MKHKNSIVREQSSAKVSVIMPAYNSERYIGEAISSILNQTYSNIELIVVDDGSTDSTGFIVKSFSDPRVIYIHQENKGVRRLAETLNRGLEKCTGELVTMFPSDDVCITDRFAIQVPIFDDPEVVLTFGRMYHIDTVGNKIGKTKRPTLLVRNNILKFDDLRLKYVLDNFIPQPSVLFRRAALVSVGGYQQPKYLYAEDYPTQMALTLKGRWIYVDSFFAKYRIHENQMTNIHVMPMYRTDARYRLNLVKLISEDTLRRGGLSRREVRRYIVRKMYRGYLRLATSQIKRNNFDAAWQSLTRAFQKGAPETKLKAIYLSLKLFFARLGMRT